MGNKKLWVASLAALSIMAGGLMAASPCEAKFVPTLRLVSEQGARVKAPASEERAHAGQQQGSEVERAKEQRAVTQAVLQKRCTL